MTAHEVRRRLNAVPFRHFELCLADGRALPVEHPDLLAFEDGARTVVLCQRESLLEVVDLMLVLSIRFNQPDYMHTERPAEAGQSEKEL